MPLGSSLTPVSLALWCCCPSPGGQPCMVRGSRPPSLPGQACSSLPRSRLWRRVVAEADLVLDGIVGIGGRPGLRPAAAALVDAIADDAWVIAVDVASGLDPDGVDADDDAVWADETVTFGAPKPAHLLPAGEAATGRLTVVDIGVATEDVAAAVERLTYDDVAELWPVPGPADDKYSRGVLGIVAGGETYTGAAVLSVTAAVESGVGMVRYVGTPTPTGLVRGSVPEAVIGEGQVQAWVVGPGLDPESTGEEAAAQLRPGARRPRRRPAGRRRRGRPRPGDRHADGSDPAHAARRRAGPAS